jgi:hypothetical protein
MAEPTTVANDIVARINRIIHQTEQAQAEAAAIFQMWNKLGGAASIAGATVANGATETQISDAVASLGTLFPDILGTHGTNFYVLKD